MCVCDNDNLHLHPLKSGLLGHGVVCILWRADPMGSGEKGTVMAKWRFVTVPTPTAQKPGTGRRLHLFIPALKHKKQKKQKKKNTTHWQNQWNPLLCNHGTISISRSEYRQVCDTHFFSLWPLCIDLFICWKTLSCLSSHLFIFITFIVSHAACATWCVKCCKLKVAYDKNKTKSVRALSTC